jgi:membrane-bound ClpP family serine protease
MKRNIDNKGRTARGGMALILFLAAGCLVPFSWILAALFAVAGLFTLFEALKGWCAVRACGIKTRF